VSYAFRDSAVGMQFSFYHDIPIRVSLQEVACRLDFRYTCSAALLEERTGMHLLIGIESMRV
jgi:hypothetical protein